MIFQVDPSISVLCTTNPVGIDLLSEKDFFIYEY